MNDQQITMIAAQAMLAARDPARAQSTDRAVRKAPPTREEAQAAIDLLDQAKEWIAQHYAK